MKKAIGILLALTLLLSFAGCVRQEDIDNAVNDATAPLKEQIAQLNADIAAKAAEIETLEGEKTALTEEKAELEGEIDEIDAQLTTLNGKVAELEASGEASDQEISKLKGDISDLEEKKTTLTASVAALETAILAKDTEIATLNSSVAALETEKQTLTDRIAELEAENETLKNCLKGNHEGGTATCTEKAVCVSCNNAYGELNSDNHKFVDGVCACGTIDATEMTAEQLNTAMTELLSIGKTGITVILKPDTDADKYPDSTDTMQYAIRSALSNSTAADGSVDLTIKGLKVASDGFLGTFEYWDEETGEYVEEAAVTKVSYITLTDATEIGWAAFMDCTSLVSVSAPNLSYIALEAFAGCTSLETLSLTAAGEITLGDINSSKIVFGDPSISGQVKLILHANKQTDVTENAFAEYTFEAVMYICVDGTTAHSVGETVAYFWNKDYTICSAGYACTKCSYVDVEETVSAALVAVPEENHTTHSAVFINTAFETQTKKIGYIYDSETNTYSVWDEGGLNIWRLAVAEDNATSLTLMDDITLSTEGITVDKNGKPSGSNWESINIFKGMLNGCGYSIVNLRIYDENDVCFIRYTNGATIKNLTLVNPIVYGTSPYTAGLVSSLGGNASVINCHVQGGSITGESNGTGGLIATMSYNKNYVYGCTNSAKVTGTKWVGGILGACAYTDNVVAACANTGEVSGSSAIGGIYGDPDSFEKLIACYTTTSSGVIGNTSGKLTACYYIATEDTDGIDGTTAVADVNTAEVVDAMNAAIDTYNSSATVKLTYKWAVGENGVPVLVETE